MGYSQAIGVAESGLNLEAQISWHFAHNCYPPVPSLMVEPAAEAVRLAQAGESDKVVNLPGGVEHRTYGLHVPAWVMIQQLRLEAFLGTEEE
jgi:hypothetical protein